MDVTSTPSTRPVLTLTAQAPPLRTWVRELWDHREVMAVLARKDFQVRYKRAVLGVLWAIAVPLVQAGIMALVFGKLLNLADAPYSYGCFVLAGVLCWTYLVTTLTVASTSIVDGSGLTEKVWFPRAVLPLVPGLANLVSLGLSLGILLVLMPVFDAPYTVNLLLLVPAVVLIVGFIAALSLCLAALHVYFRDVRYLVGAGLLVWFYVTPIIYTHALLGDAGPWLALNPMTGVVNLFQRAIVGDAIPIGMPLAVSVGSTVVLAAIAAMVHRRHDRLFADLL
jgi:lipopolysaccharide transport system permease protein